MEPKGQRDGEDQGRVMDLSLATPVTELGLPHRVETALLRNEIRTLQELLAAREMGFVFAHGLGTKSVYIIEQVLDGPIVARIWPEGPPISPGSGLRKALSQLGAGEVGDLDGLSDLLWKIGSLLPADASLAFGGAPRDSLGADAACPDAAPMGRHDAEGDEMSLPLFRATLGGFCVSESALRGIEGTRAGTSPATVEDLLAMSPHANEEALVRCLNAVRWGVIAEIAGPATAAKLLDPFLVPLGHQEVELADARSLLEYVARGVSQSERAAEIWLRRSCVSAAAESTLREIADELGVTRERIRQLSLKTEQYVVKVLERASHLEIGGALIQPWLVRALDRVIDSLRAYDTIDAGAASEVLGLPAFDGKQTALALVLRTAGYSRVTLRRPARVQPSDGNLWVRDSGESCDLERAIDVVARCLVKSVIPVPRATLLTRVQEDAAVSPSTASRAIDTCPIAVPAVGLSYETEFRSLRSWADRAYRVLFDTGTPMKLDDIVTEIAKRSCESPEDITSRSVAAQMLKDGRVCNIGRKGIWGLVDWGIEARTVTEIADDILKARGEGIGMASLISQIRELRPDVRDASIYYCIKDCDYLTVTGEGLVERSTLPRCCLGKDRDAVEDVPVRAMNIAFAESLGVLRAGGDVSDQRPVAVELQHPLALRIAAFVYQARGPWYQGGKGYYKLQLILPGQGRDAAGSYNLTDGAFPVLAAYVADHEIFILWDAQLHEGKRYGFTLTASENAVLGALGTGVVTETRTTASGEEQVILAHRSSLKAALQARWDATIARLTVQHGS
jgi:hypothetical protein